MPLPVANYCIAISLDVITTSCCLPPPTGLHVNHDPSVNSPQDLNAYVENQRNRCGNSRKLTTKSSLCCCIPAGIPVCASLCAMAIHVRAQKKLSYVEGLLYGFVCLSVAVSLAISAYTTSRQFDHGGNLSGMFKTYPGWIPPFRNDLSDIQWRLYREGLPKLVLALALYSLVSQIIQEIAWENQQRLRGFLHAFRLLSSILFLLILHGSYIVHILAALLLHYFLTRLVVGKRRICPLIVWTTPACIWFWSRTSDGIPFSSISPTIAFLDSHSGPVRWQLVFNLLMLRMISWSFEYHWTVIKLDANVVAKREGTSSHTSSQKERENTSHPIPWYSLPIYLEYCLYLPLYLTGPTITYNDFVCQLRTLQPPAVRPTHTARFSPVPSTQAAYVAQWCSLAVYGARVAVSLLLTELLTHTLYCNAITRFRVWDFLPAAHPADLFSADNMAALAFFKLIFLWLKFVVIWRIARFFSMLDGIDPPENMLRCVCNNYDVSGFWRTWHASFNRWIVRYIYIPLGGKRWRLLNVWVIFTFVSLWHDLEWHLLRWAWLMAALVAIEMAAKSAMRSSTWSRLQALGVSEHICAACAAVYIAVMMVVNLVGYGFGKGGVGDLVASVGHSWGTCAKLLLAFFCAAHLMFELRRREAQKCWHDVAD